MRGSRFVLVLVLVLNWNLASHPLIAELICGHSKSRTFSATEQIVHIRKVILQIELLILG